MINILAIVFFGFMSLPSFGYAAGEPTKPAGTYGSVSPTSTGGVNQALVKSIPAYSTERLPNVGWWFCGQAAMSSAINYLRGGTVDTDKKLSQLTFFHDQLKITQPGYEDDINNPHREANIDALKDVINTYKSDEFSAAIKKGGDAPEGRAFVRDAMLEHLNLPNSVVVALSTIEVSGVNYGHFIVIYKIEYKPSDASGGKVYYWDPYYNSKYSKPFKELMDKMIAWPREKYSVILISRK